MMIRTQSTTLPPVFCLILDISSYFQKYRRPDVTYQNLQAWMGQGGANKDNTAKWLCTKNDAEHLKIIESLAHGYSSGSTHMSFPMKTNMTGFR